MDDRDKLCCVTLDEMEISTSMEYDASSKEIMGDVTLPGHKGQASHAMVVMLGGIFVNFDFCNGFTRIGSASFIYKGVTVKELHVKGYFNMGSNVSTVVISNYYLLHCYC